MVFLTSTILMKEVSQSFCHAEVRNIQCICGFLVLGSLLRTNLSQTWSGRVRRNGLLWFLSFSVRESVSRAVGQILYEDDKREGLYATHKKKEAKLEHIELHAPVMSKYETSCSEKLGKISPIVEITEQLFREQHRSSVFTTFIQ